jgi:hypothetical protein
MLRGVRQELLVTSRVVDHNLQQGLLHGCQASDSIRSRAQFLARQQVEVRGDLCNQVKPRAVDQDHSMLDCMATAGAGAASNSGFDDTPSKTSLD